jgi:nucleoside phosphorylase
MDGPKLTHDNYTVAWICPLEVEQIAAILMLDEQHPRLPQPQTDHNAYTLGSVKGHNVVIAGLPSAGNAPAATVVAQMVSTFPKLRFGLLVGIGGGVPVKTDEGPVRLGHVVVSKPTGQHSGAVQYDHGKAEAGEFTRTGVLAPPPHVLLNAAQRLSVARALAPTDPLTNNIRRINTSRPKLRQYRNPGVENDHLYEPDYVHIDRKASCQKCECDPNRRVRRNTQEDDSEDEANEDDGQWVVVHRGTIAAGEKVIKDGVDRDRLAKTDNILCFEMEAAGALNDFPCLVIRGISDYSDSHKNDKWHGYSAAAAAAYTRELFNHLPVDEVTQCKIAQQGQ